MGDHIILHIVFWHIVFTLLGTIRVEVIILANESVYFAVDKDVGLHDTTLLKRALDSLPGVSSIKINKQSCSISVDYETTSVTPADIRKKIELLGYPIQPTY